MIDVSQLNPDLYDHIEHLSTSRVHRLHSRDISSLLNSDDLFYLLLYT